jgi:hypothetical protein
VTEDRQIVIEVCALPGYWKVEAKAEQIRA